MPPTTDAGLVFTGRIHTPWTSRLETPRHGRADGPLCRIEVFESWVAALDTPHRLQEQTHDGTSWAQRRRLQTLAREFEKGSGSSNPGIVLTTGTTLVRQCADAPTPSWSVRTGSNMRASIIAR
jgi:hypothetical protein